MEITILQSNEIYKGKVFNVRQDEIRFPNGHSKKLDIVEHHGAVVILPVDEAGNIWFIRQYRHAAGQVVLEIPAGTLEPGEVPLECARREIREEIGMAASVMDKIGEFYIAPGYSTEYLHIYLASDLTNSPLTPDDDEMISVEKIPVQQAYALAESGQIHDSKTLASLAIARSRLLK